jgi:hypothetical protein
MITAIYGVQEYKHRAWQFIGQTFGTKAEADGYVDSQPANPQLKVSKIWRYS